MMEPQIERIAARCPHFGVCGGCQYQDLAYEAQLEVKRLALLETMERAGISELPELEVHAGDPWEYRNRVRFRVERVDGAFWLGYNVRATTEFLPITQCPIAAPVLWRSAEALLAAVALDRDVEFWLAATSEVEVFCNEDQTRVVLTLLCAPRTKAKQGSLARCWSAVQKIAPEVTGLSAIASDVRTGPTGRVLDSVGAAGLLYRVLDEDYWISRGGFFQVNRFLLPTLVELACEGRSGDVAWDLYAGVGLFSRVLAQSVARVVAVEANAVAAGDNRNALRKLGDEHRVVAATTLEFLQTAMVQRERPDLIVLDPPRAGAGVEACELLLRLHAPAMVYVSCDPATLARDLAVLERGYRAARMHMVDLFPQTMHLETVVVLERKG